VYSYGYFGKLNVSSYYSSAGEGSMKMVLKLVREWISLARIEIIVEIS
jgi:hypothetical protein